MNIEFRAEWGQSVKVITISVTLLLVIISIVVWFLAEDFSPFQRALVSISPMLVLLFTGLFAVRKYSIRGTTLWVHRFGWVSKFELSKLQSAYADATIKNGSRRLFGNGGLFGFIGIFYHREFGKYHAYVTNFEHAVVIMFADKRIVVSPHNPKIFVQNISEITSK